MYPSFVWALSSAAGTDMHHSMQALGSGAGAEVHHHRQCGQEIHFGVVETFCISFQFIYL
jgi:hypothetical protein